MLQISFISKMMKNLIHIYTAIRFLKKKLLLIVLFFLNRFEELIETQRRLINFLNDIIRPELSFSAVTRFCLNVIFFLNETICSIESC